MVVVRELSARLNFIYNLMITLGYKCKADEVCFGVAHLGARAFLLDDITKFSETAAFVVDHPNINYSKLFMEIEQKNKEHHPLSLDETKMLEIKSFFERIDSYHHLYLYTEKSPELPWEEIEEAGIFSSVYNEHELANTFELLDKSFSSHKIPISAVLQIEDRAMTIGYTSGLFSFIDSAKPNSPIKTTANPHELAAWIMQASCGEKYYNDFSKIACAVKMYVGDKMTLSKITSLFTELKNSSQWQKIHNVQAKVDQRDFLDVSWLNISARAGDNAACSQLIALSESLSPKDQSAVLPVIQQNNVELFKMLLSKINVNKEIMTKDRRLHRFVPLVAAIKYGRYDMAYEILSHPQLDMNVNQRNEILEEAIKSRHIPLLKKILSQPIASNNTYPPRCFTTTNDRLVEKIKEVLENSPVVNPSNQRHSI